MSKIKKFKRIKQFRKHQAKLALMALAMSNLAYADLTTGLVAYYPFTGNANDASGNGNNGTVYGATLTADRNGNANSAYSFDGASYINVNHSSILNVNTHTIIAWVNSDDDSNGVVVGKVNQNRYETINLFSDVDAEFCTSFATDYEINHDLCSIGIIEKNSWHFIAMTYDGSKIDFYRDGSFDATHPRTGNVRTATSNLAIGRHGGDGYTYGDYYNFKGSIDEVRIYNRALSATEIQQLYQQNTPQATTTTLASSLNPAALGQNVIFTGKVTAATVPNGNLTFKIDGSTKYTSNLTNGQLTYATNTLTAGAHTIRAEYAGNTTFAASAAQLTQTITSKPDLIVTAVNLTPSQPTVSNTFTATVTVKNQGGTGNGGQLRLWTNQPTAQACAASGGDKTLAVGSVAAGASKTLTFTGINPGVKGAKILRAFVDAACTVAETNDTNNQLVKGYMVKDLRADFIVTALTVTPANPQG